jgi:hypothetical protein
MTWSVASVLVAVVLASASPRGQNAPETPPPGDPARWDRMFETEPSHVRWEPNRFLMEVTRSMTPGDAIDVGMGSGRNALFLARSGWRVTGPVA